MRRGGERERIQLPRAPVCMTAFPAMAVLAGVSGTLTECLHNFCRFFEVNGYNFYKLLIKSNMIF